jgi:hypothetical protein
MTDKYRTRRNTVVANNNNNNPRNDHATAAAATTLLTQEGIDTFVVQVNAVLAMYKQLVDAQSQAVVDVTPLRAPLARLTKLIIEDVHKIEEHIYVGDHNPALRVLEHPHGADLVNTRTQQCIELKVSTYNTRSNACNFNWPLANVAVYGQDTRARHDKVVQSVRAKTANGGHAHLVIKTRGGDVLFEYTLSGKFLVEYFTRIRFGKSNVHNMGCKRCTRCQRFPRMDRLQEANDRFAVDPSSVDWSTVVERVEHVCE